MAQIILPDEHLILIGMIAIRNEVSEQLLDMLLQGWYRDLPSSLLQDVRQIGTERKIEMLREAFQATLAGEADSVGPLFDRLLAAHEDRKAILHEAWVLSEVPDTRELGQPMLAGGEPRRRITTRMLSELDRTLASLLLELTLLFARANEARSDPLPASPDIPGPQD